jgi:GNAT superfamily N-acetyltransferase
MDLQLADAEPRDAQSVARLLGILGHPASVDEACAHVERYARDPSSRLILAREEDSTPVGLLATHIIPRLNPDLVVCRITELVVDRTARRRGVGEALLEVAEEEARRRGARRIELSSAEGREESHPFYLSCGFERVGVGYLRSLGD